MGSIFRRRQPQPLTAEQRLNGEQPHPNYWGPILASARADFLRTGIIRPYWQALEEMFGHSLIAISLGHYGGSEWPTKKLLQDLHAEFMRTRTDCQRDLKRSTSLQEALDSLEHLFYAAINRLNTSTRDQDHLKMECGKLGRRLINLHAETDADTIAPDSTQPGIPQGLHELPEDESVDL